MTRSRRARGPIVTAEVPNRWRSVDAVRRATSGPATFGYIIQAG